ncbi:MAG: hypothetical protein AB1427_12210 [Thermodesulfobacteriota bacterium]
MNEKMGQKIDTIIEILKASDICRNRSFMELMLVAIIIHQKLIRKSV